MYVKLCARVSVVDLFLILIVYVYYVKFGKFSDTILSIINYYSINVLH